MKTKVNQQSISQFVLSLLIERQQNLTIATCTTVSCNQSGCGSGDIPACVLSAVHRDQLWDGSSISSGKSRSWVGACYEG